MTADTLMIFDVTLGSSDLKRSGAFYDAVLGTLGHGRSPESTFVAFSRRTPICAR